jgi:hypothetical protein
MSVLKWSFFSTSKKAKQENHPILNLRGETGLSVPLVFSVSSWTVTR